ncbi:MAG: hypothetical protein ACOC0U_05170 [Desulfovibrionales bacterium]
MNAERSKELRTFLKSWTNDANHTKGCFLHLKNHLEGFSDVDLDFVARPGITYSLRAARVGRKDDSLFAMVDIIDDDPEARWLSVCFYDKLVDDPKQLGDEVPGGLLGEDARCFDLYESDDSLLKYIEDRLSTARLFAGREQ